MVIRTITLLLWVGALIGVGLVFHWSPVAIGLGLLFVVVGFTVGEGVRLITRGRRE
jgi:hypothetical protein